MLLDEVTFMGVQLRHHGQDALAYVARKLIREPTGFGAPVALLKEIMPLLEPTSRERVASIAREHGIVL